MSINRWLTAAICVSGLLAACGGDGNITPATDSGVTGDMGGGDVRDTGGGTDTRPTTDRPPAANPCMNPTDISAMTPGMDGNIRIMSNNNSASAAGGLTPPDTCFGAKGGEFGFQVIYRYTMRATAVLRVSTDNMGTDRMLDTMLMVSTMCSPSAMSLGCDDDNGQGNLRSTVQTAQPIMAGTTVFIAVGSFTPPAGMGILDQGNYELTVRELAPIAVGMPCAAGDTCVMGAACVPNPGSTTMGTCRMNGSEGGACNMADPRCSTGLACTARSPMAAGLCRTAVMAGGACDPTTQMNICTAPAVCVPSSPTAGMCGTPSMEMEPNNTPMAVMSQTPAMGGAVFTGGLAMGTDVDCYRITVPMGAGLRLTTSDGGGGCPMGADTLVTLYNPAGMQLVQDDDDGPGLCSNIDPATDMAARNLPAGDYTACVSAFGMMPAAIMQYFLTATVVPPGMPPTDGGVMTDGGATDASADVGGATDVGGGG